MRPPVRKSRSVTNMKKKKRETEERFQTRLQKYDGEKAGENYLLLKIAPLIVIIRARIFYIGT